MYSKVMRRRRQGELVPWYPVLCTLLPSPALPRYSRTRWSIISNPSTAHCAWLPIRACNTPTVLNIDFMWNVNHQAQAHSSSPCSSKSICSRCLEILWVFRGIRELCQRQGFSSRALSTWNARVRFWDGHSMCCTTTYFSTQLLRTFRAHAQRSRRCYGGIGVWYINHGSIRLVIIKMLGNTAGVYTHHQSKLFWHLAEPFSGAVIPTHHTG